MGVGAAAAHDRAVKDRAVTRLREISKRVSPTTLAQDRRLEVLAELDQVLPGGLQRGSTVGIKGPGALSLGLALVAGPVQAGGWLAAVGCGDLCLVAAEQAGVALHRVVLVDQPPPASWGTVVAALVDAFDLVLVSGSRRARTGDARRLLTRLRERGSVVVDLGGVWPEAHDTVLEVTRQDWSGLGVGHGVLEARQVVVEVSGRRGVRPRSVPLWLPAAGGGPVDLESVPLHHAGADVDALEAAVSSGADVDALEAVPEVVALERAG